MWRSHFLKAKSILEIEANRNLFSLKGKINSCWFSASQCIDTTLNVRWWIASFCWVKLTSFNGGTLINKILWKWSVAGVRKRWIRNWFWSSLYLKLQHGWDRVRGTVAGGRRSVKSSLKWGREAADLNGGGGERQDSSPSDPPVLGSCLWHFLIWCRISGEIDSWNYGTQSQFIQGSLCCSWSRLCSAHAPVQYLEKSFHLLNINPLLVFQSLFQQLLILNLSCHKSRLKGIQCSCFSYVVACFYRNMLFLFCKWCLDSCCEMNFNPIFVLQFFI